MKALVISGGGSKGAWAGGLVEYLSRERGMDWDIMIGASTGSLLLPCISVKAWDEIKRAYTTSQQHDIFSSCPFTVRKRGEKFYTSFNHFRILLQFIQQRKTLGESKNLRELISRTFTRELWRSMKASGKVIIITVSNLTTNRIEYKYARDYGYEEFCDWIWISCNLVPFMSLVNKNGYEYGDGGFGNPIPIQEVINLGATEIDVVILQPRHRGIISPPSSNAFMMLLRVFNFMQHQLSRDDSYIFDPGQMSMWWQMGYEHAQKLYDEGFWNN
jgi:predicted patatin/cPLA2 family phospholipase